MVCRCRCWSGSPVEMTPAGDGRSSPRSRMKAARWRRGETKPRRTFGCRRRICATIPIMIPASISCASRQKTRRYSRFLTRPRHDGAAPKSICAGQTMPRGSPIDHPAQRAKFSRAASLGTRQLLSRANSMRTPVVPPVADVCLSPGPMLRAKRSS